MDTDLMAAHLAEHGFAIREGVVGDDQIGSLRDAVSGIQAHAIRDVMRAVPAIAELARSPAVRMMAEAVFGPSCFAVRGLLFDKTPAANWKVAWHQDLTIATRFRRDHEGFGPWSMKAGIPHVQPPTEILDRMVTLRIHLDLCGEDRGPLRVFPGSHREGKLSSEAITDWKSRGRETPCLVDRGGVLIMKPLILHTSSTATRPEHRRVIHLEFAAESLPGELEWHGRW